MSERGLPVDEVAAQACPFVAFEDERDERSSRPDHRHRCYAELHPAPRALAHQEAFCLASAFPACPTFQDWARREAARERPRAPVAIDDTPIDPIDPFESRTPAKRPWAAPPPWLDEERRRSTSDPEPASEGALWSASGGATDPVSGDDRTPAPEFLDRRSRRPDDAGVRSPAEIERPVGRQPGRGLADVDPERPWLPASEAHDAARSGDVSTSTAPSRSGEIARDTDARDDAGLRGRTWRADGLDYDDAQDDERDGEDASDRRTAHRSVDQGGGLLGGVAAGIGGALGRDTRPRVGGARPGAGPSSREAARPAARVSSQARAEGPPRDPSAPAWERPRRMEAYPTLKTRMGLPSVPRVALGFGALLVAALAVFLIPLLLFGRPSQNAGIGDVGATTSPNAGATASIAETPTPAPTPATYSVKPGDTLSGIAKKLGVTLDALLAANPQIKDPNKIGLGDQINIPSKSPTDITDASPSGSPSASP